MHGLDHGRGELHRRQQGDFLVDVQHLCLAEIEVGEPEASQEALRELPGGLALEDEAHIDDERLGGPAHQTRDVIGLPRQKQVA